MMYVNRPHELHLNECHPYFMCIIPEKFHQAYLDSQILLCERLLTFETSV